MRKGYPVTWAAIALIILCSSVFGPKCSEGSDSILEGLNPAPPTNPVRLIFIHHSTGENWLSDDNGGLGIALRDNNYYVSDTNYGWGPGGIGDRTDVGNWWEWFRGPESSTYLTAVYNEGDQHCPYSRFPSAPTGENQIILFKPCFPNSALQGSPDDPVPPIDSNPLRGEGSGSEHHTVANAKGIYIDLLNYFASRQDKLFIVISAPPLIDPAYAGNARAFNQWLVNDWLQSYPHSNVFVFDFYNVLTSNGGNRNTNDLGRETGNHHRWWNDAIQHKTDDGSNVSAYPSSNSDDHPNRAGNLKATGEFLALLNTAYNRWKGAAPGNAYYVAKTGNDSNPGSETQPWLSIQKAADSLLAGDTVYIRSGAYNERVISGNSGSAGNDITYTAYPGETVTLDGSGIPVPEDEGLFYIHGRSYIKVSGLRVVNSSQAGIYADASSSHITIQGNYTNNTGSSGIGVWNSSSIVIDGNEVESSCSNGWQENITVAGTASFEVKNNLVHNELPEYQKEGICIKDGSSDGKVYGNHVHHTKKVGIYLDAWDKHTHDIDVFQNRVHDTANDGITVASEMGGLLENIRIYNNLSLNNSFLGISVSRNGPASTEVQPLHKIEIINNTVYNNGLSGWGGGISVGNPDAEDIVIRNNICSQNLSFQIVVGKDDQTGQRVTVDHNLIDGFRGYTEELASETYGDDPVEGDPRFVDASGGDFHLQGSSPAIDMGSSTDAPSTDYESNIRPQGSGYDIGAYEHEAVEPLPDLTGEWVSLVASCRRNKCRLTGSFNLQNNGEADAASSVYVAFYLSSDQTYSEEDTFLKQASVRKLKAGTGKAIRLSVSLPAGVTVNGQYVIAAIDMENGIAESNEDNNQVAYGPLP